MRIIFLFIFFQIGILVSAQSIILGIRDNQYARLGYTHKHWSGVIEQSVFASKFKNQVLNGYLGYNAIYKQLKYNGTIYGGVHYNKLYHSYGLKCEGNYQLTSWCHVKVGLCEHFDSSYGYETTYLGSIGFKLYKEIYLITSYTNYPEYRLCEERIKSGLILKINDLFVKPEISIPIRSKLENVRLLLSFNYKLNIRKL